MDSLPRLDHEIIESLGLVAFGLGHGGLRSAYFGVCAQPWSHPHSPNSVAIGGFIWPMVSSLYGPAHHDVRLPQLGFHS